MTTSDPAFYREVYRYMGISQAIEDEELVALVRSAIGRVYACAVPRSTYGLVDIEITDDAVFYGAHSVVRSADLARHLQSCKQAFLFAATLGLEVDRLIERDSELKPSLALAEQAVATVSIERYADVCCREIEEELESGLYITPRFSPGYGDCDLSYQRELLRMLDAYKTIGLTLTDRYMMVPMKSISGWLGITEQPTTCFSKGCATCSNIQCAFRKAES